MFASKFVVEIVVGDDGPRPCPIDWLDNFCMRNFTGDAEFDDTLPVSEGKIEAGFRVDPDKLASAMGAWFTKRGKAAGRPVRVLLRPILQDAATL